MSHKMSYSACYNVKQKAKMMSYIERLSKSNQKGRVVTKSQFVMIGNGKAKLIL